MFYSHEILTSRKYGVATVWLVATLGAKSNLKKINRKAIRDVNVPKACQTIIDPAAPMALRLQGNLLYGVSRVYLEQCGYVLSEAQNAHAAMRMMLNVVKNAALDPDAGRVKPEQLILRDDPSFLPEFALPPPELLIKLSLPLHPNPRSGESQSLTPFGSQVADTNSRAPIGGLVLPSSSPEAPGEFRVQQDDGTVSIGGAGNTFGEYIGEELLDVDFGFDADGNIIDYTDGEVPHATTASPGGPTMNSNAGASERVRAEHEEGQRVGTEQFGDQMDLESPIFGNDDFPDVESFPTASQAPTILSPLEEQYSSAVTAPMRRKKRTAKVIPADATMELRNKDLSDWNNNYLHNMTEASRLKKLHKSVGQAKRNAEYYVWGSGIAGLGRNNHGASGPLDMFIGDKLFELFTGIDRKILVKSKRNREIEVDEETEAKSRRVRQKSEEYGRGIDDEGTMLPDDDIQVEIGREAPSALDDQQIFSAMPWNITASVRGSSAIPGSVPQGSTLRHRGSRMVSGSPLQGRGQSRSLDALRTLDDDFEFDEFLPGPPSSDGMYTEIETNIQPPTRVREALSAEGENFLAFISDAISTKRIHAQGQHDDVFQDEAAKNLEEVLFEELLPPAETNRMVAGQGLMMVLALGTRGLVHVRQDYDFEEIGLSLTVKGEHMQALAIEEANEVIEEGDGVSEDENDEMEIEIERSEMGESQVEELLAAGVGSEAEENDEDDE